MIYYGLNLVKKGVHYFQIACLGTFCLCITTLFSCQKTELIDNTPQLEITVLNENGGRIQGASVTLYDSEDNWNNGTNFLQSGLTDSQGIILFEELEEQVYFIYAEKDELSNQDGISALNEELQINVRALLTIIIK